MRYRITFAKTEVMRFTSHLDTQRTWERTIRRAGLPLAYSQGYNPRPKINLASALPLGITSSCELAEIWLERELPEIQVESDLKSVETPGLQILIVESIDLKAPKLPKIVQSANYTLTLIEPVDHLNERIQKVVDSNTLVRERRGKEYDLRLLIEQIEEIPRSISGEQRIQLKLAVRTGATGRPDEVLSELGIPFENVRIHRTELVLKSFEDK